MKSHQNMAYPAASLMSDEVQVATAKTAAPSHGHLLRGNPFGSNPQHGPGYGTTPNMDPATGHVGTSVVPPQGAGGHAVAPLSNGVSKGSQSLCQEIRELRLRAAFPGTILSPWGVVTGP